MSDLQQIHLTTSDNEEVDLYVIEETKIHGVNYLLVTDSDSEEADCYIFKDTSADGDSEACYEEVEDDEELNAVFAVFEQLMSDDEDTEIIK